MRSQFQRLARVAFYSAIRPAQLRYMLRPPPPPATDLSPEQCRQHLALAADWICAAQDARNDGGVSAGYAFYVGWYPSYPETTGYTVPTFLNYAELAPRGDILERASRMLDFLLPLQDAAGWFPAGNVADPREPSVFNSAMILSGLVHGHARFGREAVLDSARRCARWIADQMEPDGSFSRHNYNGLARTYASEISASLAELHAVCGGDWLADTIRRANAWVLEQQQTNGWYRNCDNSEELNDRPLTHLIGYTTRGLILSGQLLGESAWIDSAQRCLEAIIEHFPIAQGRLLDGRLDAGWQPRQGSCCVAGAAQIAISLFLLDGLRPDPRYPEYARALCARVAGIQDSRTRDPRIRGGLPSSFPVWGSYLRFYFNNWGIKYFMDALMLDLASRETSRGSADVPAGTAS